MIGDLFGLLAANLCFLAAGLGVTGAVGWWSDSRSLRWSIATSYIAGVASYGVAAQLLYVLGASLSRSEVLIVCAVLGLGVFLGFRRKRAVSIRRSVDWRTAALIAVSVLPVLALIAVDLWYQPLWWYDAWTFWTPKAHALWALNGLDVGWFTQPGLAAPDYPLLLPAIEAAGFRFTGYETGLLDVQAWLLLLAFLVALFEITAARASLLMLWASATMVVVSPAILKELASAEADIPLAVFFAMAGACALVWLRERKSAALVLSGVFAAGAAATKVEGTMFVCALYGVLTLVQGRRWRALAPIAAGAAAVIVGILPWRIWCSLHHVPQHASADRVSHLGSHVSWLPPVVENLVTGSVNPAGWLLILPFAAAAVIAASRAGRRDSAVFVGGTLVASLAGLIVAFWSTPQPDIDALLAHSGQRVLTAVVLFAAATAPLLVDRSDSDRPKTSALGLRQGLRHRDDHGVDSAASRA